MVILLLLTSLKNVLENSLISSISKQNGSIELTYTYTYLFSGLNSQITQIISKNIFLNSTISKQKAPILFFYVCTIHECTTETLYYNKLELFRVQFKPLKQDYLHFYENIIFFTFIIYVVFTFLFCFHNWYEKEYFFHL